VNPVSRGMYKRIKKKILFVEGSIKGIKKENPVSRGQTTDEKI
jgi:hypothetical protein